MPDAPRLSEPLRRIADANLRYYEGLGRLTVDYVRALAGLWNEVRGAVASPPAPAPPPAPYAPPRQAAAPRTYAAPAPAAPALVLEGEGGAEAGGLFRVTNDLQRTVSAPVVVSPFRDGAGGELRVPVRVEPGVVTLDAGQNAVVQVHLTIPPEAEAGATYHAEVNIPGLAEGGIPLVLRRLPTPAAAAAEGSPGVDAAAAAPPAGRARRRQPPPSAS